MKKVTVYASKNYDVLIGNGILPELGGRMRSLFPSARVMLVTDDCADRLYGDTVRASLCAAGFAVKTFCFPNGEASKNMTVLTQALESFSDNSITRSDVVVALGGGVTGDLAGFAASVWLRGIPFVQVPTTLLAAVDSSVGGKTAVDLAAGKNLVGSFWQPSLVLCDCNTFSTLPPQIFADGMAETIKYGMISERLLFDRLEHMPVPEGESLQRMVASCVRAKRDVVARDEFDKGDRQLLNFGHTAAHGIERASGYTIPHGHAVAAGMALITRAAVKRNMCSAETLQRLCALLERYELPVESPYGPEILAEAALSDKKRQDDMITLVLPVRVGKCRLYPIAVEELQDWMSDGFSAASDEDSSGGPQNEHSN